MEKNGIFLCLLLLPVFLSAQNVEMVTFKALQDRLKEKNDTTYIVNFWATWCAPCRKEIPFFEQLQEKYSSQNVKVLLVSLDFRSQLESGVIPFVTENGLQSEVLLLDEPDQATVIDRVDPGWSGALPATLLVNASTGAREFYEGSFTFNELEKFYLLTQK